MAISMLLAAVLLIGTVAGDAVPTKDVNLAQASNDLAFDLLRFYQSEQNVLFSPFSISTALGMVYLGTNGTTSQQMREVLHYNQYGLSEEEVLVAFKSLLQHLQDNNGGYQLSSANNLFVQDNYIILHIYAHALRLYYSAQIESVNFAKNGTEIMNRVNSLVDSATRGKIKDFLSSPLDSDTKLFILNAVYFIGNWLSPFNPESTRNDVFFNNGVTEKNASTMFRDGSFDFVSSEDLDAKLVVLPYKGNNTASMLVLLPNTRSGVAALAQKLNQSVLENLLSTVHRRRLLFTFPKFNVSSSPDLVPALSQLGLAGLFSDAADFSLMVGDHQRVKVSSIKHKAVLEVNERGTEAAAATGIEIVPTSLPPTVRVNHPFLYFIRDNQSGMILFAGRVDSL